MTLVPYDAVKQVTQVFLVLQGLRLRHTQVLPAAGKGWHGGKGGKSWTFRCQAVWVQILAVPLPWGYFLSYYISLGLSLVICKMAIETAPTP